MNYEKKYKEALEKARQFSEHPLEEDSSSIVEYIFPELKESEDEKIRKALIRFHKSTIDVDGIKGEDIIAWLEKQGTSYTKRDVDDAFVEGIALTKYELEKQCEKKPTEWSKEDERIYYSILADIRTKQDDSTSTLEAYYNEKISWLKSLKQRIGG